MVALAMGGQLFGMASPGCFVYNAYIQYVRHLCCGLQNAALHEGFINPMSFDLFFKKHYFCALTGVAGILNNVINARSK
ncbi:MAG: hypothetical protein HC896_00985 [Bacteroidales bacterium]|nr:hypothetical protein [Bacteroidales bacterium]